MIFSRSSAKVVVVWTLLLLSVPGLAMILGQRAVNLEGSAPMVIHPPARSTLFDRAYWGSVGDLFAQTQPLRDNAITVNAWMDVHLLGDQPTPGVVVGKNGWFFTADDSTKAACNPNAMPVGQLRQEVERLATTASKAGFKLVVAISPDKSPVEREHLPDDFADLDCVMDNNATMRQEFGGGRAPWMTDLWSVVDGVKQERGSAFYRSDSHLNPYSRVAESRAVIEAVSPGIWNDAAVVDVGKRRRETDLSRQAGLPITETQPYLEVRRAGVTTSPEPETKGLDDETVVDSFVEYRSEGAPMIPGKTVIIHDSQFALASGDLLPWFENVTFIHWNFWGTPQMAKAMEGADTVIVETVERATMERLGGPLPDLFDQVYGG